ncbi:MAG: HYR domain-containing protein, partial [Bacteroidota bacterium]
LNALGTASITASQINNGSSDNCGIASLSLSKTSFNCSNVGNNAVTLTVTDVNGNSSTCSATVTVIDNIAPAISCPANIAANNTTGLCGAIINYTTPVGTDICGATTTQTAGLPSGSLFPVGTTVNTFTVTDPSGNQTSCSFSVSITDTQAPVFSNVPSNIIACNPVSWVAPTVTDNCAGVQVTSSHVPGSVFPSGTTTVTYTATDVYGLISIASFNVTVSEPSIAANSITSNRDFNNICAGENITLTINGGTLGAGASWKWYTGSCGGTLLSAFNGQTSITVAPTSTTTYFARAEGQCNSTGCVSITVNVSTGGPTSAPTFSTLPTAAAPGVNSTVCVNPVPGATFYQWFTQNGHNQSILFNGQVGPIQTSSNCVNVSFVLPQQNYFIRVFAGNACGRTNQTNG